MDFEISKKDFASALRQVLQGRKPDSSDLVNMTAERAALTSVVTGTSVEVPIEAQERGSFSIPIGVLFKVKRISVTYDDARFRIRVSEGRFRLQGMSTSHPGIKARQIARRVIDIPQDARPQDVLSLALIFSVDEIEDCGLHVRLLEAQNKMTDDVNRASELLAPYGIVRDELREMANRNIKTHAETMRKVLFAAD
jgi:hypothetical protein